MLNFNFTDDAKTVTRGEILGSSAVDNAPPYLRNPNIIPIGDGFGFLLPELQEQVELVSQIG